MTTKDLDPQTYSITIKKVVVDGEMLFRGSVSEFPDVETYGKTSKTAYDSIIESLRGLARLYEKQGRQLPNPQSEEQEFSGRITFRMPKSLHRRVAAVADSEGVSLNQFLVATIGEKVGSIQSTKSTIVVKARLAEGGTTTEKALVAFWQAASQTPCRAWFTGWDHVVSGLETAPSSSRIFETTNFLTKTR